MAYVTSQGLNIHYTGVGEGRPLLMHHGTMLSGAAWAIDGYLDDLKANRRLILIDARGYGESDKPHDTEEYVGSKLAQDVIAVIDDLGVHTVTYWGYSLGAHVGYELANIAPHRLDAMVLGAGTPYPEDTRVPIEGDENDHDHVRAKVLACFGLTPETIPDKYRDVILANDFIAVRAALRDRPSAESAFEKMTMPSLIYVGDQDPRLEPSRRAVAQLPNAKLVVLPGLDHVGTLVMKDRVMPHAKQFLEPLT
jgi:pimeloyl-ACP methyl ester carboxylesterase